MATLTTNETNNNTNDNNLIPNVPSVSPNNFNTTTNTISSVGVGLAVYSSSNVQFSTNTNTTNFGINDNSNQSTLHNYPTSMNIARHNNSNSFLNKINNNSNTNRIQSNLNTQSINYLIPTNNHHLSCDASRLNQNMFNVSNCTSSSSATSPSKPTTSSISSSSKSSIATISSSVTCGQNLTLTSRDWFSYVYKIENIEELIKPNENQLSNQQNFVQSPIFSFTNHLVYSNSTNSTSCVSTTQKADQSNSSTNSSSGSSSSNSNSTNISDSNNNNSNNINNNNISTYNSNTTKKTSNWRLIFYPNGAGADCKNFLSIFLKYLSDEPVKIQMMFSIVDNNNQDIYVKYTVNKFSKSNDWGFKQLIHKNAILYQKEKFLKPYNGGTLSVRVRMRLDEQKHDYIKKLNDNLHYCKLLSENFSQYYYNNDVNQQINNNNNQNEVYNSNTSDSIQLNSAISNEMTRNESLNSHQTTLSSSMSHSVDSIHFKNFTNQSSSLVKSNEDCYFNNSSYYDLILLVKSDENDESKECKINRNNRRTLNEDCSSNPSKKFKSDFANNKFSLNNNEQFIEIRAHKCILAARSPVFKAMFNYKLKENLTNKLIIEDCKPDVVRAMLKYIYTSYIQEDIKTIAIDLYIAAEKYFIESLKIKCREYLAENLTTESVIHTFILSELYNDSMLRKQSLKFISENIEKVTQNSDWNDFMVAYPQYFTNAFIRLCKKDF
jgi:hypothetical protein